MYIFFNHVWSSHNPKQKEDMEEKEWDVLSSALPSYKNIISFNAHITHETVNIIYILKMTK